MSRLEACSLSWLLSLSLSQNGPKLQVSPLLLSPEPQIGSTVATCASLRIDGQRSATRCSTSISQVHPSSFGGALRRLLYQHRKPLGKRLGLWSTLFDCPTTQLRRIASPVPSPKLAASFPPCVNVFVFNSLAVFSVSQSTPHSLLTSITPTTCYLDTFCTLITSSVRFCTGAPLLLHFYSLLGMQLLCSFGTRSWVIALPEREASVATAAELIAQRSLSDQALARSLDHRTSDL